MLESKYSNGDYVHTVDEQSMGVHEIVEGLYKIIMLSVTLVVLHGMTKIINSTNLSVLIGK